MRGFATSIALLLCASPAFALEQLTEVAPLLGEPSLKFDPADIAAGWAADGQNIPGAYRVGTIKVAGMAGAEALAIAALPGAEGRGGLVQGAVSVDAWRGKRMRLTARLKSENVDRLHLWLSVLGPDRQTQMRRHDMSDRPIRGTTDWRTYEIVMDIPPDATFFNYGFYLEGGKGAAFGDGFTLEAVGPEVAATPLEGLRADGWQLRDFTPREQAMMRAARLRAVTNMKDRGLTSSRFIIDFGKKPNPWEKRD
jgi:hypothetical protein